MYTGARIPRWVIEDDPAWEKLIDSDPNILKWSKKGSDIQAICSPTSIFCEIKGESTSDPNMLYPLRKFAIPGKGDMPTSNDIRKFLSSRYLNPSMNHFDPDGLAGPDYSKLHKFRFKTI
jgi:hypothetical protein